MCKSLTKSNIFFKHGNRWFVRMIWARPVIKSIGYHYNIRVYPIVHKPDISITCDLAKVDASRGASE
jgi:hypothetical protein